MSLKLDYKYYSNSLCIGGAWSIKLVVPAECGAYGGFDPRWGRHSGGITNLTDHKRLLFFHKNNHISRAYI